MKPKPKFIQGAFAFEGAGLAEPKALEAAGVYKVPGDKRAQLIYMRAGNSSEELVSLVLTKNGSPLRYFPIGAKSSFHVSLAVVEDIFPESELSILLAAPAGTKGVVVIDFGLVEID